jgi:hypothetical protein
MATPADDYSEHYFYFPEFIAVSFSGFGYDLLLNLFHILAGNGAS